MKQVGVRWTVGDVSARGFRALRLSAWGAYRLFGPGAEYAIVLNGVPLERARELAGELPAKVRWLEARREDLPAFLAERVDPAMAEGVAWKFAPLRVFPGSLELSLDNDCILWELPEALRAWLADPEPSFVIAEDVKAGFGQFARLCDGEPRNSGIRGLPPGFDLLRAFEEVFAEVPAVLRSELDEQGLQMAALERTGRARVVRVQEVTICSPFPPHLPYLGTCGAHFVGLNAKSFPWSLDGKPAHVWTRENWERLLPEVERRLGLRDVEEATLDAPIPQS